LSRPDPASRGSFALRHARGRRKAGGDFTPWGAPSGWSGAGARWRSAAAAASRSAPMTGRWIEQERSGEVDADPGGQQHLGAGRRLRRCLGGEDAANAGKDGEEAAPTAPPPPPRLLAANSHPPCCSFSSPPLRSCSATSLPPSDWRWEPTAAADARRDAHQPLEVAVI
jgi:hypothetical protein